MLHQKWNGPLAANEIAQESLELVQELVLVAFQQQWVGPESRLESRVLEWSQLAPEVRALADSPCQKSNARPPPMERVQPGEWRGEPPVGWQRVRPVEWQREGESRVPDPLALQRVPRVQGFPT